MTAEGTFYGAGRTEVYYRIIKQKGTPKAAVILVHGFGDHSGGLHQLSAGLSEKKYTVYALDLRGHGKSAGKRGYVQNWDEFKEDLQKFEKLIGQQQPKLPVFLVGHSMGALISLDYAMDHGEGLSGVAAISPAISYQASLLERIGLMILNVLKPDLPLIKKGNFKLKEKDSELQEMVNPEGLRHNTITPALGRGLLQAISRVERQAQELKLPFLLQYGLDDRITPPEKLRRFFGQAGSFEKQVREYRGVRHRPFDEAGKAMVLDDLTAWLDQQMEKNYQGMYKSAGRL
ncbi:alpha/beta hydrolase [Bacillus sp. FJAT-27251]|uniref:alpha/beta hydrolase n=1 Tax=Bacillus sp. FJAT-27251 TaxID=1684142 RepID=UPI0006A77006|nr:alpha/beta hydrolase [Bacillus sp. FJAT-27251]